MGNPRGKALAARVARLLIPVAGFALFLALAYWIVPTSARRPWDFETYWYACRAAIQGLSPYDTTALERLAHRPVGMPFLYAPITIPFLLPLTLLPVGAASLAWLWLKVAAFAALVALWRRSFLPRGSVLFLIAAAALGFDAACIWDLRTGNVAIWEQLVLWAGFAAYAAERRRLFAVCVVAAALFKLFPIAFLALLLVPSKRSAADWRPAVVALAAFFALVWGPGLTGQPWAQGFLHDVPPGRPYGEVNPCALGLIDTLLGDHVAPLLAPPYHALALWLAYAAAVVGIGAPALRRLWRRGDPREWVLAAAILYGLLVPRLMVYSYLLVIVPVLALATPRAENAGGPVTVVVILCLQALMGALPGVDYSGVWGGNLAFFMLLVAWLIYVAAAWRDVGAGHVPAAVSGPP